MGRSRKALGSLWALVGSNPTLSAFLGVSFVKVRPAVCGLVY